MDKNMFVCAATIIFGIIGLVHLYRAINSLPVNLMGWDVPVVLSWVVGVVALLLAYSGWRHWR